MGEISDVAVVGAGPAGVSAACILAGRGIRTIVFERGGYPGSKNKFERGIFWLLRTRTC